MKGRRKRIVLWLMTGLLMIAGLSMKSVTARAETTEVTLTEISTPSEVDEKEKLDIGLIHLGNRDTTTYYKFTVTERSWVIINTIYEAKYTYWQEGFIMFSNPSLLSEVYYISKSSSDWDVVTYTIANSIYRYYLDPGTYYIQCQTDAIYAYRMPVSKIGSVTSELKSDKSSAIISVHSPNVTPGTIEWTEDKVKAEDITSYDYENITLENSFEVENNGTYSILVSFNNNEWRYFPILLSIDITGIVKCEHDFSAYDSDAEGHIKKCSKCGKYATGKKEEHTCDEGTVTAEPTTLKEGVKTFKCVDCAYTIKTEKIPKLKSHPYHTVLTDSSKSAKYRVIVDADMGTPAVEYYKPVKNLATVTIPAKVKIEGVSYKVTAVAANAFKNNAKLKKITIGSNVDTIGSRAFYGCKNLKDIVISTKKLYTVGNYAIKNINSKAVISVPRSKRVSYKRLFTKKTGFKNTMTIK